MGSVLRRLASMDRDFEIVAGIDSRNTSEALIFPAYTELSDCQMTADAIIDFSIADAVPALLKFGVERGMPLVICTTGLTGHCFEEMEKAAEKVAVFQSANMSLGINTIKNVLEQVTGTLEDSGFDIEILEKHHNQKLDAPSGTALLLADAINDDSRYSYVYDRTGNRQKRSKKEIGISSIRGGTIAGEHTIIFAGKDEVIEFTHKAYSKDVFGVGALKAAQFIKGKPPGFYTMRDLMAEYNAKGIS
jgi:4-hydroxy-tetrahydrodipicolinate reductase